MLVSEMARVFQYDWHNAPHLPERQLEVEFGKYPRSSGSETLSVPDHVKQF